MNEIDQRCNFCGRRKSQNRKLTFIEGKDKSTICAICINEFKIKFNYEEELNIHKDSI